MKLSDLIPDAGRPVAYYPGLRRLTGSTNAALLLCQLIYWHGKQADKDGWIFKRSKASPMDEPKRLEASDQSIERETGLTYKEQKSARRQLRERGFLRERRSWIEHRIYFRLDVEALRRAWNQLAPENRTDGPEVQSQRDMSNVPSGSLIKGTYIDYTQTTTQKKTPAPGIPSRTSSATSAAIDIPATPAAAMQHPDIQLFQEVCGRVPGSSQYRTVIETMQHFQREHGSQTVEYLRPFWLAWSGRKRLSDGLPYDPSSLTWLTEWALNGTIPPQKGESHGASQQATGKEQALGPTDLSAARRINRRLRKARLPALRRTRLPSKGRAARRS